jgi:hypothetical protein
MYVRVDGGTVDEVRLDIYEPPRFFEAFLRGNEFRRDGGRRLAGGCGPADGHRAERPGIPAPPPLSAQAVRLLP